MTLKLIEGYRGEKKEFGVDPWPELMDAMKRDQILQEDVVGLERVDGDDALVVSFGPVKGLIVGEEIGDNRPKSLAAFVGIPVAFKVMYCDQPNGVAYLSRRKALEAASQETWKALQKDGAEVIGLTRELHEVEGQLKEEAAKTPIDRARVAELKRARVELLRRIAEVAPTRTCTVRWVSRDKATVDIGGVAADLPAKEMSYGAVYDARSVVRPGDSFDVKVVRIDPDAKVVVVSLRPLLTDPWKQEPFKFQVGGIYRARVVADRERSTGRR
ncbi:MAG: S1 RNA-binding domain-containing protein, partial [Anaerolineae bacterium]